MKNLSIFLSIFCLGFVAFSAYSVYAAGYGLETAGTVSGLTASQVSQVGSIPSVIGMIVSVLLALVGVIFFLLILYGGFTWMVASGSMEQVTKAKKILQNSAIGLVAVLAAYSIANFVFSTFLTPANATCATTPKGSPSLQCKKGEVCDGANCVDACKYLYKNFDAKAGCINVTSDVCDGNIISGLCGGGVNTMCCVTKEALRAIEENDIISGGTASLPQTAGETECEKSKGQFCISKAGCTGQNGKSMGVSDCGTGMVCCQNCNRAGGTCIDTDTYQCNDEKNLLSGYCHGLFKDDKYKCCKGEYSETSVK